MDKDELQTIFETIDRDGSGTLDFDEFLENLRVRKNIVFDFEQPV